MKDLLEKLSSYNLFNYLFPGIIFVVLAEQLTSFSFIQQDLILGAFYYYFIGMIISRVGSLIIEPILKKVKFVTFAPYSQFVAALKKDDKIDILSETNNMYRTFCSVFLSLIILKCYELFSIKYTWLAQLDTEAVIIGLFVLFLFSYKKQTQYVSNRVSSILNKED